MASQPTVVHEWAGRPWSVRRASARLPAVNYWPFGRWFLSALVALLLAVVVLVAVNAVTYVYGRLGLSPGAAFALLFASLLGSAVNIPLARLPGRTERFDEIVIVFGVPYIIPTLERTDEVVVAVNLGGALIPAALSVYLFAHDDLLGPGLVAVSVVTVVTYLVARRVPGVGIVVPSLVPPIAAIVVAWVLGGHSVAAVAYVGGTLGTLIGGDLLNLRGVRELGAPVVSIGGAGTFDGVFLTGILAVLLAGI